MGNNTSTYDRVPSIAQTSLPSHGFHVLCVVSGSNASLAGVEAFFDYVVSVDGKLTSKDDELLLATRAGLSNKLDLVLFSSKSRRLREVTLESHPEKGFGFTVRQCVLPLEDRVWHILDVLPNSPAEHAGLRPVTDYIVGLAEYESDAPIVLTSRDSLFEAVEAHIGAVIPLVVYSTVLDSLRRVDLAPRFDWGGPGCMGCDIGYGPLHRIP
ncbi:GRASP55/65 PDZ-like domain-containing protein, partial [Obelidium mucronatum]